VLDTLHQELRLIAEHRASARGDLRVELLRVESRWAGLAAWLGEDTGQRRARDAWTNRALALAREASYPDMVAVARRRQSESAAQDHDAQRAVAFAEGGMRVRGTSAQTRAGCARQAALGYALAGDAAACERSLDTAYSLLEDGDSPAPPWAGEFRVTRAGTAAAEARCWLILAPAKAISLYARGWPASPS